MKKENTTHGRIAARCVIIFLINISVLLCLEPASTFQPYMVRSGQVWTNCLYACLNDDNSIPAPPDYEEQVLAVRAWCRGGALGARGHGEDAAPVAPPSLRRRRPSGRPWPRARPRWCPPAAGLRGIVGVAGGIDLGRGSRRQPRAWSWRAASMQSQLAGGRHRCRAAGRGRPGDMDGQRPTGICDPGGEGRRQRRDGRVDFWC
jgi:hypothetical protein